MGDLGRDKPIVFFDFVSTYRHGRIFFAEIDFAITPLYWRAIPRRQMFPFRYIDEDTAFLIRIPFNKPHALAKGNQGAAEAADGSLDACVDRAFYRMIDKDVDCARSLFERNRAKAVAN